MRDIVNDERRGDRPATAISPSGCGRRRAPARRRSSPMSRIACVAAARIPLGGARNATPSTCAEVP